MIISNNMRLQVIIILIFLFGHSFGQDTINKIKLKPLSDLRILNPNVMTVEEEEFWAKKKKGRDSIYDSDTCQKVRDEIRKICERNLVNLITAKNKVRDSNNLHTPYYYFLVIDYIPIINDTIGCFDITREIPGCTNKLVFIINKKEKSRLILDGPSGEIFYYDDIKRIPIGDR